MTTAATAAMPKVSAISCEVAADSVPNRTPVLHKPLVHVLIPVSQPAVSAKMRHQQAGSDQQPSNHDCGSQEDHADRDRRMHVLQPGSDSSR